MYVRAYIRTISITYLEGARYNKSTGSFIESLSSISSGGTDSYSVPSGYQYRVANPTFANGYGHPIQVSGYAYTSNGSQIPNSYYSFYVTDANGNSIDGIDYKTYTGYTVAYRSATYEATALPSVNVACGDGVSQFTYTINSTSGYQYTCTGNTGYITVGSNGYLYIHNVWHSTGYTNPTGAYDSDGNLRSTIFNSDGEAVDKYISGETGGKYRILKAKAMTKYYARLGFDANGGKFNDAGVTYCNGKTRTFYDTLSHELIVANEFSENVNSFSTPTRTNYTFKGWSISGETPILEKCSVNPSEDTTTVTLKAVWESKKLDKFYWDGGTGSSDSSLIYKGGNVSNITATRWNALLAKIKELSDRLNISFSYTSVSSGGTFFASNFNKARSGIVAIRTALSASTPICDAVSSESTIKAEYFIGMNSLRDCLNILIGIYNNNL